MKPSFSIVARQAVQTVAGWPTDTFSVDIPQSAPPHTVLVFVPGNPGLIEWYIRSFKTIISQLGPGYAARGVSNVGASLSEELVDVETLQGNDSKRRSLCTPWTVDGQVMHKVAYMDLLRREFDHAEYIFVAHSLGAHLVTRLCVLRPDILQSTKLLLFLTPYIRMKAPPRMQAFLNMAAARPHITINVHRLAMAIMKRLSLRSVETLMSLDSGTGDDPESTKISAKLARLPLFARNFFLLGTEEVRDIPECFDVPALRYLSRYTKIAMLYGGNDHWAPEFHMNDLEEILRLHSLSNISYRYEPTVRHTYTTDSSTESTVVSYCLEQIGNVAPLNLRCKL